MLEKSVLLDKEEMKAANEVLKPRDCPRCEETNPATARFCCKCGMALELKTAQEIDEGRNAQTFELIDLIQREPRLFEILKTAINT